MSELKELLVINYEYPPIGGGAGNACKHYCEELAQRGFKVDLITSKFKDLPRREDKGNLTIRRVQALRSKKFESNIFEMFVFLLSSFTTVKNLLSDQKPDHIIIFFAIPFGLVGYFAKLFLGIPYSVFVRGSDIPGFQASVNFYQWLLSPITKLIFANAEKILTNGEFLKELTLKTVENKHEAKVINVPNGVDTEFFYKEAHNQEHKHKLELLFVGRLVQEQKNITVLPKIMEKLQELDIHLNIIGDGPDRKLLEKEIEQRNLQNISIHGWLDKEELKEKYHQANALIMPSFSEGVSNVLLEALASGLYIIGNDIPDLRYFVEKTQAGSIATTNLAAEYVEIIQKLYQEGITEISIPEEELSWDHSCDQLLSSLQ